MLERLQIIEERYNNITDLLSQPDIISNIKQMTELSKEQTSLKDAYEAYQQYKQILADIEAAKEMLNDSELGEFAKEELNSLYEQQKLLDSQLEIILLPKDPNDDKNVIVEIRGAAGGDEGNIFAGDLFHMYNKYADKKGWNIEILNAEESEAGGYSQIEFIIKGDKVYSKLKYESGAHRVQRVPETETSGRIHTSTSTVAVLPEVDDVEIEINPTDLKVDTFRASGAGGQHVNKTESAIRITHIPSGVIVECQTERSQIQNRETAMKMLRSKLYEAELEKQTSEQAAKRRTQVGSGDRSEKIRTYNFPQGRITDHRINLSMYRIDDFLNGDIDEMIDALNAADRAAKLADEEE